MPYSMLIVEDSELVVQKLKKLLEPLENISIDATASDGYTAVKLIKELNPDYVILDISLKYGHGIKVLEEIYGLKQKPYVIVLSNLNYQYYKDKCLKLGADHFFDKAMEFEKVYEVLNERTGFHQNAG
ncbi:MAG: response regulator receiver protein [Chlorobi bacterium OLB5]|nr:MAG: response regulator receiver protein [Chlorobi bacterium OLB5]